ncbi:Utp14 protein-domain-containing protein [Calycina marina]|uniref:Utp14 protein-domain-containing protein n=1 Tax=Calycina marina TaxID=1763456 RepID=A0A9P7Z629_9HELO|nr:Utp14 protein-domain-containing protein [Calycina marina]
MPGRQSHGGLVAKKSNVRNNPKKRALEAFSIASHQTADHIKVRANRLGATEEGGLPSKRRKNDEDDEDEEGGGHETKKPRKGPTKGRFDELDIDEGSDSEGNEWKLGQVDSDDDSNIDSDEAFGESDEEKFDGYAFSGSTENQSQKKKKLPKVRSITLDEDDLDQDSNSDEESDELGDELGDDAIDLAAMLDATEEEEQDTTGKAKDHASDFSGFSEEDEDSDEASGDSENELSSSSFEDASNPAKLALIQEMINGLPQKDRSNRGKQAAADSTGILLMDDAFAEDSTSIPKKKSKDRKHKELEIPLAKRQQARLDRSAAYEKTKEELGRWADTVKHNRRADHLMFPLPNNDVASAKNNTKLHPTTISKPFNELEAKIQLILEESGLATATGQYDEDRLREYEDLETNKMSMEKVKQRRDQLRMARELLFREEVKSKRIKKIKSKSYRKVHRKQREKEDRLNKDALAEGGFEPSEDELEAQDRRRATERMGQKHRESKWAKATKATGRAAWDEDARSGIIEMARREEELRKRVEGKVTMKGYGDNSASSSSESDDDYTGDSDGKDDSRLLRKLKSISRSNDVGAFGPGSKLANMKFMLKAEASRKQDNDAMVEEIRREITGGGSPSDAEDTDVGRRIFGPSSQAAGIKSARSEFEEREETPGSGEDVVPRASLKPVSHAAAKPSVPQKSRPTLNSQANSAAHAEYAVPAEGGAWSKVGKKQTTSNEAESKRRRYKANDAVEVEELDLSQAAMIATQPKLRKPMKTAKSSHMIDASSGEDDSTAQLPFVIRDQELIQRAFAGADVVGEFETEKRQTIMDDDEKVVDSTLPGWGSWTGDGLSKREKARNRGRVLTKVAGIKEANRKDAKLDRVIINEKRVKKNSKYLASTLPHVFESKQQYERSLRMPIGPEWATKESVQGNTKPRILLKQGIIAPMLKPLL